jgi:serine protease Do
MPFLRFAFTLFATLQVTAMIASGQEPPLKGLSSQFRSAASHVVAASVSIEISRGPRQLPNWRGQSGHTNRSEEPDAGCGTGIVIDSKGYVLTCCHVLDGADYIAVKLSNGVKCEVLEVLKDPVTDLAVLKIRCQTKLLAARFGDSDRLQAGDWVLSVTSPYGMQESISAGIVSAVNRQIPEVPRTRLIQTDAASNPGSSGGPLINLDGEVIGVCEGSYGPCEGFHGISFAIPANIAKRVALDLIANGRISRGYLGCGSQSLTPELADSLALPVASGVILTDVSPSSPAAAAGLQAGDAITHFAGNPVRTNEELQIAVEQSKVGQTYSVRVIRGTEQLTLAATPAELPVSAEGPSAEALEPEPEPALNDSVLGLHLDELHPDIATKIGYFDNTGVLITKVVSGGLACEEGICAGMVIKRLGSRPIRNLQDYQMAMMGLSAADHFVALVSAPGGSRYVRLRLPQHPVKRTPLSARNGAREPLTR